MSDISTSYFSDNVRITAYEYEYGLRRKAPTPIPLPIPIVKNIYVSSSGSFIGVLNLTIDSAPTRPKERANDDFTTTIISVVPILIIGRILAKDSGLEKLLDWER